MTCNEYLTIIKSKTPGDVSADTHKEMAAHYKGCKRCYALMDLAQILLELTHEDKEFLHINILEAKSVINNTIGHFNKFAADIGWSNRIVSPIK